MQDLLWQPSQETVKWSNMTAFTNWLRQKAGVKFPGYAFLHEWTVDNLERFWAYFLEFTELIYSEPHWQVLDTQKMPGARWFSGMKLNFAENILARGFEGTAIAHQTEACERPGEISFEELRVLVARCVRGLKAAGIGKGDRVAGYMANVPEAVVGCLAAASLGATWSSASPDFGLEALCDRFSQVKPKLVFASTHYCYKGKIFRTDAVVKQLHGRIPSAETVVSIPYRVGEANIYGDLTWDDFLGSNDAPELTFTQVPFDHPLYILFSSGTTGAPKCLVHGTGGTLLQHRKEHHLHCNLSPRDFLLYFTTCGWMMWNWQLSALSLGVKICLYDGSPAYPDVTAIWRLVDEHGVTHFGTSGHFIESCMKRQPSIKAGELGEFPALGTILYTGSPLSANGFRWIYDTVKKDLHLAGISGGTDIVSCFIGGNSNLPVIAGEIQCKSLGVDVVALDEDGQPVTGAPGELVCRKPLPSMPVSFLNDPSGKKYRDAYFDVYPGIWRHGDYVEFTPSGGAIVYGRSDATLNPGGVRIGSAEIYSALDSLHYIVGSVVVGWHAPDQSDEVVVLCVVLSDGFSLSSAIETEIRQTIRAKCSPRHVPEHICQTSEVPITRSGKTVELTVKAILHGKLISNRSALANPSVLGEFDEIRTELLKRNAETT